MTCREDSLLFASHRVCALRGAYIGPIYRAESRASKHEARSDWLYENRSALIVVGLATPAKRVHCNDAVTRKHRWPALSLITPCLALSFPAREQPSKCRESFRVLWNGQSVSSRNSAKEQCSRKRKVKFLLSRPFTIFFLPRSTFQIPFMAKYRNGESIISTCNVLNTCILKI